MKLTTQQAETGFKPVSFTITCETQDELDFFVSLFNHTNINDASEKFMGTRISLFLNQMTALGSKRNAPHLLGITSIK